MMRFLIVLTIFTSVMFLAHAQEEAPAYALAFHAGDNLQVAFFRETSGWQVENLGNSMLFGQYDISLVLPQWTENGQLMGTGYDPSQSFEAEPMYIEAATYLYRYDARSQIMETMAEPIGALTGSSDSMPPPTLAISSISPDSRYASLYDLIDMRGYLVDFETQEVLFTLDTCGLKAFHWTETTVFLGSHSAYISCPASFFEYELATGAILNDWSEALANQDITVFQDAVWLGDSEFLMASYGLETYSKLVYLSPNEASIVAPLDSFDIAVSESRDLAAFSSESILKVLDLETMEIAEVATDTGINPAPFFTGETLNFTQLYSRGSFTPETGVQLTPYYAGGTFLYGFSPDLTMMANATGVGVDVYGESGLLWNSGSAGLLVDIFAWSDNDWLRFEKPNGTISFNITTGEVIQMPEENALFISASPDGAWWLYIARPFNEYVHDRLLLYSPETAETVVLVEDADVYDNFHFPLESYFIWSPLLD